METKKHIIFDFFGTLVGYTHGYLSGDQYSKTHKFLINKGYEITYENFSSSLDAAFSKLEKVAKATNKEFSMNDVTQLFFANNSWEARDKIRDEFIEIYHSEWNRHVIYYSALKPFLSKLKEKYTLSVITNTHYKSLVPNHLKMMGVLEDFKLVLTSVECGIRKPDPRIFQKALKQLSAKPEEAIYVGDSYSADYQGSLSVGMKGILIDKEGKWKGTVEDRVDSLFDILPLAIS
jgi:putative hydrolase of the HAD superfamily